MNSWLYQVLSDASIKILFHKKRPYNFDINDIAITLIIGAILLHMCKLHYTAVHHLIKLWHLIQLTANE